LEPSRATCIICLPKWSAPKLVLSVALANTAPYCSVVRSDASSVAAYRSANFEWDLGCVNAAKYDDRELNPEKRAIPLRGSTRSMTGGSDPFQGISYCRRD
jgi:hypothetical protein